MDVGRRIREVREERGMPRTVLARRVGVAQNTIYRFEAGLRTPSIPMLERIARELRIDPAELMREPAVPLGRGPERPPLVELLEREGIEAPPELALPLDPPDRFDAIYEDLTFEEAWELSHRLVWALRQAELALEKIPEPRKYITAEPPIVTDAWLRFVELYTALFRYRAAVTANLNRKASSREEREQAEALFGDEGRAAG
jgi:transcriptional regulator with XRE-family HTH domain